MFIFKKRPQLFFLNQDLPLLTQDWNNVAVRASPGRNGKGQEPRKTLVSTIGMELERELGIQDANQAAILSSLRHPDGASDPHLDQHSGRTYESPRSWYLPPSLETLCSLSIANSLLFYPARANNSSSNGYPATERLPLIPKKRQPSNLM